MKLAVRKAQIRRFGLAGAARALVDDLALPVVPVAAGFGHGRYQIACRVDGYSADPGASTSSSEGPSAPVATAILPDRRWAARLIGSLRDATATDW
jgi:hypothetical protein